MTKLFADQALPMEGIGGNVVLVDQLSRPGAARGAAVAALTLSTMDFYAACAVFALLMMALLWWHGHATPLTAGLVTAFLLVAVAIPALGLWLHQRGGRRLPAWMARIDVIRSLLDTIAQAPEDLRRDGGYAPG